jgi:hypothetical protein
LLFKQITVIFRYILFTTKFRVLQKYEIYSFFINTATSDSKSKTKSETYHKDKTVDQKHDDTYRKKVLINQDEGDPHTAGPKGQGLHKHTDGLKSKSAPPEGDNAFNRIQTEEKNDATKTKEKQKLNDDKRFKENSLRNMENRSELFNNPSNTREENKGIRKR